MVQLACSWLVSGLETTISTLGSIYLYSIGWTIASDNELKYIVKLPQDKSILRQLLEFLWGMWEETLATVLFVSRLPCCEIGNKFFFILKMFVQNLHDKLCQFRLKWTFGWCLISFYGIDKHRGWPNQLEVPLDIATLRYLKPNYVENYALRDILAACSANRYNRRKLLWWCQNWSWKSNSCLQSIMFQI